MIISFFEEFPTASNLSKIELVSWDTKLYIASKSLEEFNKIKSNIKNSNVKEVVYWPILNDKDGYYISPFSDTKSLQSLFNELKNNTDSVMIDLELPIKRSNILMVNRLLSFLKNKDLISKFISKKDNIYVCEYYPEGKIKDCFMSILGLHFDPDKYGNNVVKMMYHSLHNFEEDFVIDEIKSGKRLYKNKFIVGYGTIDKGILKKEPKLSVKQLEKDLKIAKRFGLNEVVIYRLGGLNKKYSSLFRKYV